MSNWKSLPDYIPSNGQSVYIRLWNYFNKPISATYNSSLQTFTSDINNIIFPAYTVYRWKTH
jgi:hypothetical protein